jgi:hypothetical protein
MDVLVRWTCFCKLPHEFCRFCRGIGYMERWMPAESLIYLKDGSFQIMRSSAISFSHAS